MLWNDEQKHREELKKILYELSETQDALSNKSDRASFYRRLENLYYSKDKNKEFRHFYSDIFVVLTDIKQGDKIGNTDILGQNLLLIISGYRPLNKETNGELIDISDNLKKLYDHVSLELARLTYWDKVERELLKDDSLDDVKSQINSFNSEARKLKQDIKGVDDKLRSSQKEYIAILGIFAAVVLAFTAGIAFSTSVLENFHQSSIYRVAFIVLLIGFVIINMLFGLFYYIDRLVRKADEPKLKPFIFTNAIILIMFVLILISWKLHIVESRNNDYLTEQNYWYEVQIDFE